MDNIPIPAQILSPVGAHGKRAAAAVISFEESKHVTSCHDTRPLIVQQRCGIPFEDRRIVAEVLQGQASGQSSQ